MTSVYLSIFNDTDILPHTLRAIAPYVDELIVVDGGYDWMRPYFEGLGQDPEHSCDALYDIVEASGINYRTITRTWASEAEKRMAGYEACTNRYAFRVDADEVPFFDDAELDRFFTAERAVGSMLVPSWVCPGWIKAANSDGVLQRAGMIFDRSRVTSADHLRYLLLVFGGDKLPPGSQKFEPHGPPVCMNAHLNLWRDVESKTRRSVFYWLNWMRQNGVPWNACLRGKPLTDLHLLFDATPAAEFREIVQATVLTIERSGYLGWLLMPSMLTGDQNEKIAAVFDQLTRRRHSFERDIARDGLVFWSATPIMWEIDPGIEAVSLRCSAAVSSVDAKLNTWIPREPWHETVQLARTGTTIHIPPAGDHLRRELEIHVCHAGAAIERVWIQPSGWV
jgi:hypothetical protein